MSTLEKIKGLVDHAKSVYANKYRGDEYSFTEYYVDDATGLLKDILAAELAYPIQYEDEGDFYYFASASDLQKYVRAKLDEEALIYSEEDDYYDSSEYEDSGC